jgi:hypothetical protein
VEDASDLSSIRRIGLVAAASSAQTKSPARLLFGLAGLLRWLGLLTLPSLAQIAVPAGQGRLLGLRGLLNGQAVHRIVTFGKLAAL